MARIRRVFSRRLGLHERGPFVIETIRRDPESWLARNLWEGPHKLQATPSSRKIARITRRTNQLGEQKIWEGYRQLEHYPYKGETRKPRNVSTGRKMGRFFTELVRRRRPGVIVEFGSAFGGSGMCWLAGLEENRHGRLFTFEPNKGWAAIAGHNLSQIGSRFELTPGTFESQVDGVLGTDPHIDLAFIDAIHTSEFVSKQFELVAKRLAPGGLILLDDTRFSKDMRDCWEIIAVDPRVRHSLIADYRVGIVEFAT